MKTRNLNYRYPEDLCEKLEFLKSKGLGKEYIANKALREYFEKNVDMFIGFDDWVKERRLC